MPRRLFGLAKFHSPYMMSELDFSAGSSSLGGGLVRPQRAWALVAGLCRLVIAIRPDAGFAPIVNSALVTYGEKISSVRHAWTVIFFYLHDSICRWLYITAA